MTKPTLFEEIMADWGPNVPVRDNKLLPLFKGIAGRESIAGISYVDEDAYDKWSKAMWFISGHGYARMNYSVRNCRRLGIEYSKGMCNKFLILHREVMGVSGEDYKVAHVDHTNRDKLHNTRDNLRLATAQENRCNTRPSSNPAKSSKFKGVCRRPRTSIADKFQAKISIKGIRTLLGTFLCEIEAAKAYDKAAKEVYGEFAYLNFP